MVGNETNHFYEHVPGEYVDGGISVTKKSFFGRSNYKFKISIINTLS